MNLRYTILFLFLYSFCFSQSLQLDSILVFDDDEDIIKQFSFEYENGKISQYREDNSVVNIFYNDQDLMDNWYIEPTSYGPGIYQFKYTQDNRLDSIIVTEGINENIAIYDFEYDDTKLSRITSSYSQGGEFEVFTYRKYTYDGLVETIERFNADNVPGDRYILTYDSQGKLISRAQYWAPSDILTYVDSCVYDVNGSLEKVYRIDPPSPIYLRGEYTSDPIIDFANILSPISVIEVIFQTDLFSPYEFYGYGMLYGNKVETHKTFSFFETTHSTWHYSLYVDNKEERFSALPITVYPNPSTDQIAIQSNHQLESYFIYDMTGKIIMEGFMINNKLEVSLLPNGQYTLVCSTLNDVYYFASFVKQ